MPEDKSDNFFKRVADKLFGNDKDQEEKEKETKEKTQKKQKKKLRRLIHMQLIIIAVERKLKLI